MNNGYGASHAGQSFMRAARIGGLFVLLTAGCGGVKPAPPGESPQTGAAQAGPATVAPVVPPVTPPRPSAPVVATQGPTAAVAPAERPTAQSTPAPASQIAAKVGAPAAKAPTKAPAPATPAAQPLKKDIVAQAAGTQKSTPALDLTSLETRLKETDAIGVMTKIALKNQVDDLLDQFRAFYAGKLKTTLAELRRSYDLLVLKVLSLLQDSDPSLATAIVASREAIWGILSDPHKFATI
jgi:hypothetical protein